MDRRGRAGRLPVSAAAAPGVEWPPAHHLVVTRGGVVLAGGDHRATANPVLSVDGRYPPPPAVDPDRVRALAAVTGQPTHPCWSGAWRPVALPDPRPVGRVGPGPLVARLPLVLAPAVGGFAASTPTGPVRIGPEHLDLLARFHAPTEPATVLAAEPTTERAIAELVGAALLVPAGTVQGAFDAGTRARQRSRMRQLRARRSLVGVEGLDGDDERVPVIGLVTSLSDFPLSLGMVLARAAASERLADRYSFHLVYATPGELAAFARPAVWLFSDYLWTEARNAKLAAALTASGHRHLTVFGGPQVPDPSTVAGWMAAIGADVAVHGEGEATLEALLHALPPDEPGPGSPSGIEPVPGCTLRGSDGVRVGPGRERIADLDALPSPFLSGWFDDLGGDLFFSAVLETNRGCPYGCTFCDWGSATRSRIRTFGLERVTAEIDWIAAHGFEHLLLADANFGILERDREVAEALVRARRRHGAPVVLGTNYAKNPKRHVVDIVADLVAGGFVTIGQVALQTVDRATLQAVNRSNIAPEGYDDLLRAFDALGLPVQTDLMMGLPGATPAAFRADLQHVIDSDVHAIVARTKVLRNSPMNAPDYRRRFAIRTAGDEFILATSSFDEADLDEMIRDHTAFFAADDLGALRVVTRFVRHRTGVPEMTVIGRLAARADAEADAWPTVRWVLGTLARWAVEPVAWARLFAEVRRLVVAEFGLVEDRALDAVLAAQEALLPAFGRSFPVALGLDHDVVAWWQDLKAVRRSGGDWASVPDLGRYGPGGLVVDDPAHVCDLAMGDLALMGRSPAWDLDSPLSRASPNGLLVTAG